MRRNILTLGIFCLVGIVFPAEAWERVSEPRLEVGLGVGTTKIAGDFADVAPTTTSYLVNIVFPVFKKASDAEVRSMFGYFQVAGDSFRADYKGNGYPFQRDKSVSLYESSMSGYLCWGRDSAFQPCLGVGYGMLSMLQETPKNSQIYGTSLAGISLRYILGDKWLVAWDTKFFGNQTTVNEVKSATDFWSNRIFAVYRWDYPDYDKEKAPE